jgi:hypothetical protein
MLAKNKLAHIVTISAPTEQILKKGKQFKKKTGEIY